MMASLELVYPLLDTYSILRRYNNAPSGYYARTANVLGHDCLLVCCNVALMIRSAVFSEQYFISTINVFSDVLIGMMRLPFLGAHFCRFQFVLLHSGGQYSNSYSKKLPFILFKNCYWCFWAFNIIISHSAKFIVVVCVIIIIYQPQASSFIKKVPW